MKVILSAILIVLAISGSQANHAYAVDREDVTLIFEGVLEGVLAETNMTSIIPCITDATAEAKLFEQAIKDLELKTVESVEAGLQLLGQAIQSLPKAMNECLASKTEIARFIVLIKAFTSPTSFYYHVGKDIMVNGVQIFHEIEDAVTSYKTQQWKQFGWDLGHALADILIGMELTELKAGAKPHSVEEVSSLWEQKEYEQFANLTDNQIRSKFLMGIENIVIPADVPRVSYASLLAFGDVPTAFDSRKQWPKCIHPIRNQEHCGSCWAFSGSEVLSDRLCIASNGTIDVVLSPQYMVQCDSGDKGCEGGQLPNLWKFLETKGSVLDSCLGYKSGNGTAFTCKSFTECDDKQPIKNYYAKASSSKCLEDPASIQLEIMTHGPVQTGFYVYKDFMKYAKGIYVPTSTEMMGGHAVKIIGWGEENGVKYWICANSWGPAWGEEGHFRIKQGTCEIDTNAFTGHADVDRV